MPRPPSKNLSQSKARTILNSTENYTLTSIEGNDDPLGPEGLVASLLDFDCLSRFPSIRCELPNHRRRMNDVHEARKEMATMTAEFGNKVDLISRVPQNTNLIL